MSDFNIEGRVKVGPGNNGLDFIRLDYDADNSAEIYLSGGHLTAWRCEGEGIIFLSDKAQFTKGTAIRGGMPVIFPQFGPGLLKNHGFARNTLWTIQGSAIDEEGRACVKVVLGDSEETRAEWNYPFRVSLLFSLGKTLTTTMTVDNLGSKAFDFTCALHTYFAIDDIEKTWVEGLKGITNFNGLDDGHRSVEDKERVTFREEYDRVYRNIPDTLTIVDNARKRNIIIEKGDGFRDAVVWNPWIEKSKGFKDFDDNEYKRMLCIESGLVGEPHQLAPSEFWTGTQVLSVKNTTENLP